MAFNTGRAKRIGGVILEVALGVFLVTILVSALGTPESQARSASGPAKKAARAGRSATETLLPMQGTPPCTITCPSSVTATASAACPFAAAGVVTYPAPTTTGDCTVVVCTPPSGSPFPVGSTTVTCTTTGGDGSSNPGETVQCGFTVSVFGLCLQDDGNPGNVVLFNPFTGAYQFCCNGVVIASGTGTTSVKGCVVEIQHNPGSYRVLIKADTSVKRGTASLQKPPGVSSCIIYDRNMANNTCACPAVAPPPQM
ncbi:MAG TPA: HYR domain-containing protein [Blastocatellia bacterium]|nr:HYR domain-containing protein [Blastocatellia bacterium]